MDSLPVEILTKIIDYLTPREQVQLQLVSRRFFELSRDNYLWRLHCYEDSWSGREVVYRARYNRGSPPTTHQTVTPELLRFLNQPPHEDDDKFTGPSIGQRSRAAAEWDPSYESEDVDWYSEYIARNAPLSFSWLQRPAAHPDKDASRDVKGMGLLRDWSFAREDKVVAPLEDGTVCVWDLNHSHSGFSRLNKGRISGTSQPGVLFADLSKRGEKSQPRGPPLEFLGVGECMSIDSVRKRAYICVGNILNEVDLETLRVVHQERYAWSIFALSQETDYSVPITLATTLSLQIYDGRLSTPDEEAEISFRCEKHPADDFLPNSNLYSHPDSQILRLLPNGQPPHRIRSPEPNDKGANYAPLFQPGPLSILHPPTPHVNTILLAGRFPSILCYDRRTFPKLQQPIHSGGRLCGLASIPPPSFPVCSDSSWPNKHTIVACGDYNGRGSLELHDLDFKGSDPQDKDAESTMHTARYQNRQSAASSKLLSVASHGARIVFSDANGNIKWVERNGRTEIRRWNINTDRRQSPAAASLDDNSVDGLISPSGVFLTSETSNRNAVARKILPTDANLDGDELLLWTGDRIGRLRFSPDPDGVTDDEDDDNDDGEELLADDNDLDPAQRQVRRNSRQTVRRREKEYARMMRLALERQADEVRWMGRLGMA